MQLHSKTAPLRSPTFRVVFVLLTLGLAAPGCESSDTDADDTAADDDDDGSGSATTPDDSADDDSATTPDDSADDDSADGSADTGADPNTVDECRTECDFQLEFMCIDVDEHEACFTACGELSQDELDLFIACTSAAPLCGDDPGPRRECLANLLDIDTPGDSGETGTEGPNCVAACQAYLATPCDPPIEGVSSCDDFCSMLSERLQAVAAECLDNAVGCELPADCQLPGG